MGIFARIDKKALPGGFVIGGAAGIALSFTLLISFREITGRCDVPKEIAFDCYMNDMLYLVLLNLTSFVALFVSGLYTGYAARQYAWTNMIFLILGIAAYGLVKLTYYEPPNMAVYMVSHAFAPVATLTGGWLGIWRKEIVLARQGEQSTD